MAWRTAKSLDVLLDEINRAAPKRSKASDGSIGDAAHATRSSDHNPWVRWLGTGIVTARDFTHDPAGGLDCNKLAAHRPIKPGHALGIGRAARTIGKMCAYHAAGWLGMQVVAHCLAIHELLSSN